MKPTTLFLWLIFILTTTFLAAESDFSITVRSAEISTDSLHLYIKRDWNHLLITDTEHKLLFSMRTDDSSESIVSAGYSNQFNSYYGLVVRKSDNRTRSLICRTDKSSNLLLENLKEFIFQPVIFGKDSNLLAYISNNYTLVVIDIHSNREILRKQFEKPIYNLEAQMKQNSSSLNFQTLGKTGDLNLTIHADSLQNSPPEIIHSSPVAQKPVTPSASSPRNFRKFLCYGDSITSGYINHHPSTRGYVPRFAQLIETHLYSTGTEAIRVGNPGATTHILLRGIERELDRYDAGYLLLHGGTNDRPGHEERALESFTNIKAMAQAAIDRGMIPVLSTLIPRTESDYLPDFREINEFTNRHIRDFAASADLPLADFWNVFISHQDYDSLMSDYAHPSEKGYELMAHTWLRIIPPLTPDKTDIQRSGAKGISISWENEELDIDHWIVDYGYKSGSYNRSVKITGESLHKILNPAFSSPFDMNIFFKITAVDKDGNKSHETVEYSTLQLD